MEESFEIGIQLSQSWNARETSDAGKAIRDDEGIYEGFAGGEASMCLPR